MDVQAAWEVSVMGVGVRRKEHVAMMRHAHEDAMRLHPIVMDATQLVRQIGLQRSQILL